MFFANRKSRREKIFDKCRKRREAKERKRLALAVSAVPCVVGAVTCVKTPRGARALLMRRIGLAVRGLESLVV
jgi:hypothetical protein